MTFMNRMMLAGDRLRWYPNERWIHQNLILGRELVIRIGPYTEMHVSTAQVTETIYHERMDHELTEGEAERLLYDARLMQASRTVINELRPVPGRIRPPIRMTPRTSRYLADVLAARALLRGAEDPDE